MGERALWLLALVWLGAIYSTLYIARPTAEFLRERNLLALTQIRPEALGQFLDDLRDDVAISAEHRDDGRALQKRGVLRAGARAQPRGKYRRDIVRDRIFGRGDREPA